jgi:hypothetical protein
MENVKNTDAGMPEVKVIKTKQTKKIKPAVVKTVREKFMFGPVWNASVKSGTGIAMSAKNMEKLQAQARFFSIPADGVSAEALVIQITTRL